MSEETNRPDDEQLAEGEDLTKVSAAARLFDVRRVIGGFFLLWLWLRPAEVRASPADTDADQGPGRPAGTEWQPGPPV